MRHLAIIVLASLSCLSTPALAQGEFAPLLPLPQAADGHIIYSRYLTIPIPGTTESALLPKLFVMDADGSNQVEFLAPKGFVCAKEARWSPDYDQLVFTSDHMEALSACVQDIFVVGADGTGLKRVTGGEAPNAQVHGIVTGHIVDNIPKDNWQQPTAHTLINITAAGANNIYHPDDSGAFTIPLVAAGEEVWIKVWRDKNIGNLVTRKVLANQVNDVGKIKLKGYNLLASKPSITPDGRYVVGVGSMVSMEMHQPNPVVPGGTQQVKGGADNVSIFDVTRGGIIAAMFQPTKARGENAKDPAVSPDGQRIAVGWGRETMENLAVISMSDMLADRPAPQVLVPGQRIFPSEATMFQAGLVGAGTPAWSPDGRMIAFSRSLMTTQLIAAEIWVVNADGSGARQITNAGAGHICFQPCFSPDGSKLAFTVLTGNHGPIKPEHLVMLQFEADLFAVNLDGSGLRQLTDDGVSCEPAWGP